jgi:hypothetical protein
LNGITNHLPNISGGGNNRWCITGDGCLSRWHIAVSGNEFNLKFEIGGSGADSYLTVSFSKQDIIPIIEQIIENIKKME